jgi:hypothetical protein
MRRVIVHIERLVLAGFESGDRHAIAAGLERELGRVFGEREAVSRLRDKGDVSRLRVDGVRLEPGGTPQSVGENVAQGIGRELGR